MVAITNEFSEMGSLLCYLQIQIPDMLRILMIPILCSFYEEELQQSSFSMLKYCNFSPFIRVIRIYGGWHNNVNTGSFIASARNELKTCGLDQKSIFMHKKQMYKFN